VGAQSGVKGAACAGAAPHGRLGAAPGAWRLAAAAAAIQRTVLAAHDGARLGAPARLSCQLSASVVSVSGGSRPSQLARAAFFACARLVAGGLMPDAHLPET
jgi:hypothetical protein